MFNQIPRVDKLDFAFSNDGQNFAIFSRENGFVKVFKLKNIEKILDEIRNDSQQAELVNKDDIVDLSFGNNTKYLIIRFKSKIEIYHLQQMCLLKRSYVPESFELPSDQLECICDIFFESSTKNDSFKCYLACKVSGLKKIKVFNIRELNKDSIWETESNSINFFEEMSDNFMVRMRVDCKVITTVFVNGNEQFVISMNKNG